MAVRERLITRRELSRRLTKRGVTTVYADCEPHGPLGPAVAEDGRVDLGHPCTAMYMQMYGYQEPDIKLVAQEAVARDRKARHAAIPKTAATELVADTRIDPQYTDSDEKRAEEILQMTLGELIARYGKQSQFYDYARSLKLLIETQAKDEDAARRRKEHVPMTIVMKLVGHIDTLQTALLSETTVAISNKLKTLVKAGASDKQIERSVHDLLSRTIRTTKQVTDKAIRDV